MSQECRQLYAIPGIVRQVTAGKSAPRGVSASLFWRKPSSRSDEFGDYLLNDRRRKCSSLLAQEERFGASGELGLGHLEAIARNNGLSAPSRDAMLTAGASRAEALSETERAHCWAGIERVPWRDRRTDKKAIFQHQSSRGAYGNPHYQWGQ